MYIFLIKQIVLLELYFKLCNLKIYYELNENTSMNNFLFGSYFELFGGK